MILRDRLFVACGQKFDKISCSSEHATPLPLIALFFDSSLVDREFKEGAILPLTFLFVVKNLKLKKSYFTSNLNIQ